MMKPYHHVLVAPRRVSERQTVFRRAWSDTVFPVPIAGRYYSSGLTVCPVCQCSERVSPVATLVRSVAAL
jgi:hypothetical protein